MSGASRSLRTRAIGVILPVHNEEERLDTALRSIFATTNHIPSEINWGIAVVLDDCSDASLRIAQNWSHNPRVILRRCRSGNVGKARQTGCAALLGQWADTDPRHIWLCTTDADTKVPEDWIPAQIESHERGTDVWTGRVSVTDWGSHTSATAEQWQREYNEEVAPIHGASMGFNARTYLDAGGFRPAESSEDRALFRAMIATGAQVHHDVAVRVLTSSRKNARAPRGFAHALNTIDRKMGELISAG